jgi:chromosome segregation ATPase
MDFIFRGAWGMTSLIDTPMYQEDDRVHSVSVLRRRASDVLTERLEQTVKRLKVAQEEVHRLDSALQETTVTAREQDASRENELKRLKQGFEVRIGEAAARHEHLQDVQRAHAHDQLVIERVRAHSANMQLKLAAEEHASSTAALRLAFQRAAARDGRIAKRALAAACHRLQSVEHAERTEHQRVRDIIAEARRCVGLLKEQAAQLDEIAAPPAEAGSGVQEAAPN